jgi:hypothetical protein
MKKSQQFSPAVKVCVGAVICLSAIALGLLGALPAAADRGHFFIVLALSAVIGMHSMRYSSSSIELSSSHPFLIYSIATFGPRPAVWVILFGMATTLLIRKNRPAPIRTAFNLASIVLSTVIAGAVFSAFGGMPGRPIGESGLPLLAAAVSYLVINSALIAMVISIDRPNVRFLKACGDALQWGGVAYLTGYAIGVGILYATTALGPAAIVLILPPCWLLLSFYRTHEARVETERLRTTEVEALNVELSKSVQDLQEAMRHIKQLRGLLPICMHCKSVRDDQDVWHRLEAYLGEHSDAMLTHSLCDSCRDIHYSEVGRQPR